MDWKLEQIEEIVTVTITSLTDITITNNHQNFFSEAVNIIPRDMVYIIQAIEDQLDVNISSIFDQNDETIMTVYNLSKSIHNILTSSVCEIMN